MLHGAISSHEYDEPQSRCATGDAVWDSCYIQSGAEWHDKFLSSCLVCWSTHARTVLSFAMIQWSRSTNKFLAHSRADSIQSCQMAHHAGGREPHDLRVFGAFPNGSCFCLGPVRGLVTSSATCSRRENSVLMHGLRKAAGSSTVKYCQQRSSMSKLQLTHDNEALPSALQQAAWDSLVVAITLRMTDERPSVASCALDSQRSPLPGSSAGTPFSHCRSRPRLRNPSGGHVKQVTAGHAHVLEDSGNDKYQSHRLLTLTDIISTSRVI